MIPKKTSWGAVAKWYDGMMEDSGDSYQKKVLMPNLMRIVDPKPGLCVLDIACGQGYFSRAFAENGAKVTACDISAELIALAKKVPSKTPSSEINFSVAPADDLKVESASFDMAIIVLALQNIENLSGTLAEASRALKTGGRLAIVLSHPAFRIPKSSGWEWDEENNKQFRRIDAYMSDQQFKIDMTPGEIDVHKKKFTITFHRPLQSYVKALSKAGLSVTRLEEWISHKKSQSGPKSAEEDRIRKEIPMFVCLEAMKLTYLDLA